MNPAFLHSSGRRRRAWHQVRRHVGIGLATLAVACGGRLSSSSERSDEVGTCEIACEHYEYCKGERDPDREQVCVSECRTIFSEDGELDGAALHQLEELSCRQLLSFIEGRTRRALGSGDSEASEN